MSAILESPFGRLVWKEWRSVRGFAIALLVFGLGLLWISYGGPERGFNQQAEFIIPMIPIIALMGIVATTFAAEHEHNTAFFQRSLPASQTTVVTSKLLVGLAISVFLALIMLTVARVSDRHALESLKPGETILAACELLAWGTLVSLLSRRALVALVVSSLIAVGVAYLVQWVISPNLWDTEDPRILYVPLVRWAIVILVSLTAVAVGSAWFNDRSSEITGHITRWKATNASAVASRSSTADTGTLSRLGRLAWCQVKSDVWMWTGLLILLVVLLVQFCGYRRTSGEEALMILIVATVLGCVATSKNESERHFLSMQDVSPSMIWFSSLLLPAVLLGVASWAMWLTTHSARTSVAESRWLYALGAPVLGLAVGQLFARLTRSSVTAFGIAMLTGVFAAAWLAFAVTVETPLRYSVLPFVFLSLIATLITTRAWLYGWSGRSVRFWKYGSIAACLTISLGIFGWFRATELPSVPASKLTAVELPPSPPSTKVDAFRRLGEYMENEFGGFAIRSLDTPLVDRIVNGLDEEHFAFPSRNFTSTDEQTISNILYVLSETVRQSVSDDDSEEGLRRIKSLFDAGDLMVTSGFGARYRWRGLSDYSYAPVIDWARLEGTTPDQIAEVIAMASDRFLSTDMLSNSIAIQSNASRRLADGDLDLLPKRYTRFERSQFVFGLMLPWERARIHRYVDGLQARSMDDLETYKSILAERTFPSLRPYSYDDQHLLVDAWEFSIPDLRTMLLSLQTERAFVIRLAIARYQKLNEGNLPDSVLELTDQLTDDALIDPLQGRPFILVHPEAAADWIADNERPYRAEWEPDPMARYRDGFLWAPGFYAEPTPDSSRDEMLFWVNENHQLPVLNLSRVLSAVFRSTDLVQTHVKGDLYAGNGGMFPLGDAD